MDVNTAMIVNDGSKFTGSGQINLNGGATFNGGFSANSDSNINLTGGDFTGYDAHFDSGTLVWSGGILRGYGITNNFSNNATIKVAGAIGFYDGGRLTNNALLNINGDYSLYNYYAGGELINNGTLIKDSGTGTSDISNISFINSIDGEIRTLSGNINLSSDFDNSGLITGTASITTNQLINNGRVAPDALEENSSTLSLNGTYYQTNNGELDIGIIDSSHYGVFKINGDATWSGLLKVNQLSDYIPTVGEIFTIALVSDSVNGNFSSFDTSAFKGITFDIIYGTHNIELIVTSVPIPGSIWLFSSTLIYLSFIGQRRKSFSMTFESKLI